MVQRDELLVLKVKADPAWTKGQPRRIVLESAETVPFAHVSSRHLHLPMLDCVGRLADCSDFLVPYEQTQWAEGLRKMYDHANEAGRKRNAPHTMVRLRPFTFLFVLYLAKLIRTQLGFCADHDARVRDVDGCSVRVECARLVV